MCWISSELASSHHPSAKNNEDATGTANSLAPIHAAILPQAPPTMPSVIFQKFPSTQEVSHCNQVNVSNNEQDNAETPHAHTGHYSTFPPLERYTGFAVL
jgi:hypothetical protein